MKNAVVTYETFHGSAKKIAEVIAEALKCNLVNIDTPFEVEDLKGIDNVVLVFNFRGPYTAQLTKLYLNRVKDQMKNKNMILVGEGLFSEKEFPVVAEEIAKLAPAKTFSKFFVNGQLRTAILSKEEKVLLDKFSELTKMEIKDMGELDLERAEKVAEEILELVGNNEVKEEEATMEGQKTKWVCPLCGYIHYGDAPPEKCPLCGAPGSTFIRGE